MKQNVLITVTGIQNAPDTDEAVVELKVPGQYSRVGRNHFLIYEEIDEDSKKTTRNLVRFRDGFMEVTKTGLVTSHLLFENEKEYITPYRTPFGEILAGFQTSRVTVRQTGSSLSAEVFYKLNMNEAYVADCRLQISVRFLNP